MNDTDIKRTSKLKYLGLTIAANLNWNEHIDNMCGTAQKQLGFLRRRLIEATAEVKLMAYETFVPPTLEYRSIIWDQYQQYQINELERVQRIAAKLIYAEYRRNQSVTLNLPRQNFRCWPRVEKWQDLNSFTNRTTEN